MSDLVNVFENVWLTPGTDVLDDLDHPVTGARTTAVRLFVGDGSRALFLYSDGYVEVTDTDDFLPLAAGTLANAPVPNTGCA